MAAGVIGKVPEDDGSADLISVTRTSVGVASAGIGGASGSVVATRACGETEVVAEAAFAVEVAAGVAESEAGVDAEAGARRLSSARARADDPKNTNNMAATATLTRVSPLLR